jgi:hypothetical protein
VSFGHLARRPSRTLENGPHPQDRPARQTQPQTETPHKVFWPAYWATLDGDTVTPLTPEAVKDAAGSILKEKVEKIDDWRPLTEEQIAGVLAELSTDELKAVYIAGGKLYQLNGEKLAGADHDAAQPYAWAIAHDVRPAEQSMGVRLCKDCHTTDSPFFFGTVELDTPVKTEAGAEFVEVIQLQGIDRFYMWAFNASFVFRPMLKIVALLSCALIGVVVLTYVLKAVGVITTTCSQGGDHV